MKPSDLKHVI